MQAETAFEQLYFTTARVEAFGSAGASVGTAFIYGVEVDDPQRSSGSRTVYLLATNKHVVEGATRLSIHMIQGRDSEPVLGEPWSATLQNVTSDFWTGHADSDVDVAVMPLAPAVNHVLSVTGKQPFFRAIAPEIALSDAQASELDAVEDIVFVGYPRGLYDSVNLLPVVRRGTTATPMSVDYEGGPKFMIDASVFPGSSGSPVFIANNGAYGTRQGDTVLGERLIFVGVVAASHIYQQIADVVPLPTEDRRAAVIEAFLNLGIVFKARALEEAVDRFLRKHNLRRAEVPPSGPALIDG